jgi:hypothetical protein
MVQPMESWISWRVIIVGLLVAAGAGSIAVACAGDDGQEIGWDAESSNALISPTNDTRGNLILLMADRYGTRVADPKVMASGIVPFDVGYPVFETRLYPPKKEGEAETGDADAGYGLSSDNRYFAYDSTMSGLCHTNRDGAAAFGAALAAERTVPKFERDQLLAARSQLATACDKARDLRFAIAGVTSPAGTAYARYLEATRLFYAEDLPAATDAFAQAGNGAPEWVADTAAYMRLRASLAQAIKASVDEWGSIAAPDKRDRAAIAAAIDSRRAYLMRFPNGRYVRSARDFDRRIAWISGDKPALGDAYSRLVAARPQRDSMPDMAVVDEVDRKLLPSRDGIGVADPALLVVIDLMRLRPVEGDTERACCGPLLSRAELDRQRPLFAHDPDLFTYLLAIEAFTSRKQAREVLSLIPDASRQARFSYLQFSRQVLRGFALEAVGDRNAREFWLSLIPGAKQPYQAETVQLAILQHDRAAGIVGRLLETGSPMVHPLIRSAIIEKDLGIELLRRTSATGGNQHERDAALYVLLANELHFGMYREFLADQQRIGPAKASPKETDSGWSVDSYSPDWGTWPGTVPLGSFAPRKSISAVCPSLRETVTSLTSNAGAIHPLMCLAEYIRTEGFDTWNMEYDPATGKYRNLARPGFTGTPITRAEIYQRVMVAAAANDDEKAFALNRAVRCYQPSGINDCGGDEVPKSVRKAWYTRLKSQFGISRWAKELKYYW